MRLYSALSWLLLLDAVQGFLIQPQSATSATTALSMAPLDAGMISRLEGIRRSFLSLTERLGDPDVLGNSKLLQKIMTDRAQSEEVVTVFDVYCGLKDELAGATELFQEAGDDAELREMARAEIKEIEPQLEELEEKMKILLLPKDPNDERNIMLEIRAGTGGAEASIFAGECRVESLFPCYAWWVLGFLKAHAETTRPCFSLCSIYQVICSMSIESI
jgi:protein subunit release factor A